ncbi:MAG: hypothetical protein RBJ76_21095 [Stenomitos frigidus ULC029]
MDSSLVIILIEYWGSADKLLLRKLRLPSQTSALCRSPDRCMLTSIALAVSAWVKQKAIALQ